VIALGARDVAWYKHARMRRALVVLVGATIALTAERAACQEELPPAGDSYGAEVTTASPDAPAAEEGEFKPHRVATALIAVGGGLELGGRSFHYSLSPANTSNLRPYDIFPAPLLWVSGELYPAAVTDIGFVKDLGIAVSYAHAVGVDSAATQGRTFSTSWTKLLLGLRYRVRTGDASDPLFGFGLGYARQSCLFSAEGDEALDISGAVASVDYEAVRPSIDLRIPMGPVSLLAGFAYLGVVSAGEVYDRFTPFNRGTNGSASIGAIELLAGLGLELTEGVEARVTFEYSRYFYSFEPVPGDPYVAGGALDQFFGIRLGAFYIY
jgi:hypothetical protein